MSLEIKSIDYDNIKLNLINFLKNQTKFSNYNFDGSSMNILMDILAYNTYYQMFYNNMTFNEMFLDSAIKRSSVVSLSKMLGYVPGSSKSSKINVEIEISGSNILADSLKIPKYTKFTTTYLNQKYDFYTLSDNYLSGENGTYKSDTIYLTEGMLVNKSFIHDINYPFQKYTLPYDNIDTSTIDITVQHSDLDLLGKTNIWKHSNDITKITENSLVYFIEENSDGFYSINFGDGILGKKLENNNKINATFLISSGEINNIGLYGSTNVLSTNLWGTNGGTQSITITVTQPSYGGAERESIDSIKIKAPKSFSSQDRAVTVSDYSNIVMKYFGNIKDVNCWGGEDNNPPEYTKVFISVKPKNGEILSLFEKESMKNVLIRERGVVGVVPVIVDPDLIYINTSCLVQINNKNLQTTKVDLENRIRASIRNFIKNSIDIFNGDFYSNELISIIDSLEDSIKGVVIRVVMEKRFIPSFTQKTNYTIDFKNSIRETICNETIINSSAFSYMDSDGLIKQCQFRNGIDSITGLSTNLNIIYIDENSNEILIDTIGFIDYTSGYITIEDFQPISLGDKNVLQIFAIPSDYNIFAEQNVILTMDEFSNTAIKINLEDLPYRANL